MSLNSRKLCFQPTEPVDDNDPLKDIRKYYIQAFGPIWFKYYDVLLRYLQSSRSSHSLKLLHQTYINTARKKLAYKIKNATQATFDSIINTVEIYNGPLTFDSFGCTVVNSVRMWYNKDFMKDIAIKIKLYPWIPVIPIEYTGYHTNPKMYGNTETNKWFIKNTINK